jgi:histidyl-tRNA synthetase
MITRFINITNALDKTQNQDEYNIYVSMLDEEELECLKYVQRLRKYNNRQQLPSPTDTDESKPEKKKRGRKNKDAEDYVIMSEPTTSEEATLPPSPISLERQGTA